MLIHDRRRELKTIKYFADMHVELYFLRLEILQKTYTIQSDRQECALKTDYSKDYRKHFKFTEC